jgi:hypothetical protein
LTAASVAVRVVAAIGVMSIVAAIAYALSHGRVFLFPFLLLLGVPMAGVFRTRRSPPELEDGRPAAGPQPPRISRN